MSVAASAWTEYGAQAQAQAQPGMAGEVGRSDGGGGGGGDSGGDGATIGEGGGGGGGTTSDGGGIGIAGGGGGNVADWFASHADANTAPQLPEGGATQTTAELGPRPNIVDAAGFPFVDVAAASASQDLQSPRAPPTDHHAVKAAPVTAEGGGATSWDRGSFTGRFPPLPPPPPTAAPPLVAMESSAAAAALHVLALFGSGSFSTAIVGPGRYCPPCHPTRRWPSHRQTLLLITFLEMTSVCLVCTACYP